MLYCNLTTPLLALSAQAADIIGDILGEVIAESLGSANASSLAEAQLCAAAARWHREATSCPWFLCAIALLIAD